MKYDDLLRQSSDKHMLNSFSESRTTPGEIERAGIAQPGEQKAKGNFINVFKYLIEKIKWCTWTFLSSAQWEDKKSWTPTEIQEIQPKYEEKAFSIGRVVKHWHRLPKEVISNIWDIKEASGHNSEQPAFTDSALSKEMD